MGKLNIFFVYDQNGNIQQATTDYPQMSPPAQLLVCDETTPNAQAALAQPQNYMVQNGQIIPATTIHIDRPHALSGSWDTYTLAISASDSGAHSVDLVFLGHKETVTTPATLNIAVHQSVTGFHFGITASGAGIATLDTFIGGSLTTLPPVQVYKDAGGLLHIAPATRSTLQAYYASVVSPTYALADIMTGLGMLWDTMFNKVIPALGTQITFSTDEQNALNDIKAKILGSIPVILGNANTVSGPINRHYESFRDHWPVIEQATQGYATDLATIPNLV